MKIKNKEIFIIFFFLIFIIGGIISLKLIGELSYKIGGQRGHSYTIMESKNRGVFIKNARYQFSPIDLKLNNFSIFIEKGFIYGQNKASITDNLGENDYPYQLIIYQKRDNSSLKDTIIAYKNDVLNLQQYMPLKEPTLNDTIKLYVLVNESIYKVDTIGEIKVWCNESN